MNPFESVLDALRWLRAEQRYRMSIGVLIRVGAPDRYLLDDVATRLCMPCYVGAGTRDGFCFEICWGSFESFVDDYIPKILEAERARAILAEELDAKFKALRRRGEVSFWSNIADSLFAPDAGRLSHYPEN